MNIRVAIADANSEYVERLTDVLEQHQDLTIAQYTDKHALEKALSAKHYDILLFDPSIYTGQVEAKGALKLLLVDPDEPIPEECSQIKNLKKTYKYQKISKIYQKILEYYSEVHGGDGIMDATARTLVVFSPAGGTGKTTVALSMASALAEMGKRVFYMNVEDIASDAFYLPQADDRKGISEVMSLLGDNIDFSMKIQSLLLVKKDNFYYMNHFNSPNDIYEMKPEELTELIEVFENAGLFDFIIVDMGTAIDKKTLSAFECAEKIMIVEKNDKVSTEKLNAFFAQAHIVNNYSKKMLRIQNFFNGYGTGVVTDIQMAGNVSAVPNPDAAQLIDYLAGTSMVQFANIIF